MTITERNTLVEKHIRLVPLTVRRYCTKFYDYCEFDELISVGNIGLIKAVDGFNGDYGTAFSTYAVRKIYGEIQRYFRDKVEMIKYSRVAKQLYYQITKSGYEQLSVSEIAKLLNAREKDVKKAIEYGATRGVKYFSEPVKNTKSDELFLQDVLLYTPDFDANLVIEEINKCLSNRERVVLKMYYIERYPQSEVADYIGVSQTQISRDIRQIKIKAKGFFKQAI